MAGVVIAAHNEEAVLGPCLDALLADSRVWEVVVSANACTDRTVEIAGRPGVIVLDLPKPGKAAALNAAEQTMTAFPRVYLDADIVIPAGGLSALIERLEADPSLLVVVPRRRLNTSGRPWPVRAYCAINERLPAFRSGIFGRGLIVVSEPGRARFEQFPELIADDLFLDSQFTAQERGQHDGVVVSVDAPFTTRDLLRRLVRVRRGNTQLRSAAPGEVRASDPWAWWRDVVLKEPRLAPAGAVYVALTLTAALLARRAGDGWGRDESTRRA